MLGFKNINSDVISGETRRIPQTKSMKKILVIAFTMRLAM